MQESNRPPDQFVGMVRPVEPAIASIAVDFAPQLTYASYQNAFPVVRQLSIANVGLTEIRQCKLELTSSPPFLRAKTWVIERIEANATLTLTDRKIELDAGYLAGLNEAERGEVRLILSTPDAVLGEHHFPVRLLARDEWGGVNDMAQLLPTFVMPNDPAVARLLLAAAERLAAHGHPSGLDGYQSGNAQRAYLLTAAIYSAIAALGIHYAEPPASFELRGQKVRRPTVIAEDRLATCLDTTLLFAAALEAAGLHPVLLLFEGHAAVGAWLAKRTLATAVETDPMEIRKAIASRELVVFETTGVTHRPPMPMEAAQAALAPRLSEEQAGNFRAAIDVRRARSGGIMPLASHEPMRRTTADGEALPTGDLPLPAAPSFADLPPEAVEVKPTTASGRLERWQKKLLDLTLRNRLLNFPESAKSKTIPFLCTDVAYMEDRLSGGASLKIISLPEQNPLGERDAALYRDARGKDLHRGFAEEALRRDELPSLLEGPQLEARLTELYRQVRNDLAEGGANTLFLAIGFLRWKKKPEDDRSYRAPLLLLPAKLERRSATSRFTLRFHEDEPRFNATLAQFLDRDFDLKLPYANGDLPMESQGIDVPRLLAAMRQAVREVPGMEVLDEAALSTFSFAKFLMWKDLVERTEALRGNRVVRHLLDTPDQPFQMAQGGGAAFRDERDLDRTYAPAEIINLLPADSSQTAASMAAAEGRDFVIVGPPGTGKSQTIANMIANCLAVGKTVLFVAEKTAALDVVYRRLREHGLGDHCIELHSNKTDRRHFLKQLKAAWEHGQADSASEWVAVNERLRLRRDQLNAYVHALHGVHPNGWTPYQALGVALRADGKPALDLGWTAGDTQDAATLREMEELAEQLGQTFAAVGRDPALELVDSAEWSSGWQERLLAAAQTLRNAADLLIAAAQAYGASLGLASRDDPSPAGIQPLLGLASALRRSRGRDLSTAFDPDFERCAEALAGLRRAIIGYREEERGLAAFFAESSVRSMDIDALDLQWRQAKVAFWPSSVLAKRKIGSLLQSYAAKGQAKPERDLSPLRRMKDSLQEIDRNLLVGKRLAVNGLATDLPLLQEIIDDAGALHHAARLPELDRGTLVQLLRDGPGKDTLLQSGDRLIAASGGLETALAAFREVAGVNAAAGEPTLAALGARVGALLEARHLLRDWSAWCRVRNQAVARRLASLVALVEQGDTKPAEARAAFRLGYARWWLPQVLDSDPVLREFRRFQHENAIEDFRQIDELVRSHASRRVIGALAHGLPGVQSVARNSELGLLRHQMDLQRPSQSIREMIGRMPQNFAKLAPCMLMSPLSIAQYLPPDQALFDVVIFDEASQITTWDAVGAIARARQTIIVGDPMQLPPTYFFGRHEEDDEVAEYERDLESILDEARAAGIPVRDLRWHYRSRSESLIAFSNHHYYQNRLVTFPSPAVDDRAVHLRKVPNGIYDRGKSRTNRIEAEAVAAEAVSRMRRWLPMLEKDRPTLGVITFNAQQQSLILDLLDAARRNEPALEWFFAEDRVEATIVKNLENVQGDERDVILFSITFWKDAAGKLAMDFGALNRDGGERRLNVAVTRARQELIVFSGFTADQIDVSRTKALAVQHLKTFLDFAERGAIALPAQDIGSVGGFDSFFEEAVAAHLERRGWSVVPQVGISGFRIDLGVRHPDRAGAYLAGVECDGATYHGSATARDRDKVREQVLRGLGWSILRVWSTDWWYDAKGCADRLHAGLEELLSGSRARRAAEEEAEAAAAAASASASDVAIPDTFEPTCATAVPDWAMEDQAADALTGSDSMPNWFTTGEKAQGYLDRKGLAGYRVTEVAPGRFEMHRAAAIGMGPTGPGQATAHYEPADLAAFEPYPERFFELGYRDTLRGMIVAIVEAESPLRTDVLAQRISRAHGWQRTGARIREQVGLFLHDFDRTMESSGEFLWRKGAAAEIIPFRPPVHEEARRPIGEIPLAELAAVALAQRALLDDPDPARELARHLGVERLATVSRSRLDEALARARLHIDHA
ncbi:MAG: helicase [Rubritepida sp.]|nr:helicase [Rubritepida sp.]